MVRVLKDYTQSTHIGYLKQTCLFNVFNMILLKNNSFVAMILDGFNFLSNFFVAWPMKMFWTVLIIIEPLTRRNYLLGKWGIMLFHSFHGQSGARRVVNLI